MNLFLNGAITMAYAVAALYFLRYWRDKRDRLFAMFALAFFVLAANRVLIADYDLRGGSGEHFYWIRFCAFVIILIAILDKNYNSKLPRSM